MKIVKIGLIGCGVVTIKVHIPALMNDPDSKISGYLFQITSICSLDKENIDFVKAILPSVRIYSNYKELLEKDDCDAVLIATGEKYHTIISTIALNYGKFVLCEKPFGSNYESIANAMKNINENLKKRLQIAFNKRFSSSYLNYKKLLSENTFGKPVLGVFNFSVQRGRVQGWEGILSNLIHYCDLIISIFGSLEDVVAFGQESQNGYNISVSMRSFEKSIISFSFTTSASWNAIYHEDWMLIDDNRNKYVSKNCDESFLFLHEGISYCNNTSNSIFWLPDPQGYKKQLESFYNLVIGEVDKPIVSIQDALNAHSLFDKIKGQCIKNEK